ncbi:preprotein translocase subunit SecE [Nanchangia anserum]|uniref:preprotein translocase subunit SecE n=1 Tax=Nanchangia anserum TaxID=2692125 RepID=UPI0030B8144A
MAGSRSQAQESKPGLFARMILFVRQIVAELKKVVWPTREQLWTYFTVVIVFVLALMVFVGILDVAFASLSRLVFG